MTDLAKIDFDVPIEGLMLRLQSLEGTLPAKGMRASLVASVKPLKNNLKGRIRNVTGALKKSIGHKTLSRRDKVKLSIPSDQVVVFVGATKKTVGSIGAPAGKAWDQNYKLHWLEKGVRRHYIPAIDKGRRGFIPRKILSIGGAYRRSVEHPGFGGRDLVWKSLQATRSSQQALFNKRLYQFLDKNG